MGGPFPTTDTAVSADIVIIGGGIAGLTCAVGLADTGLSVLVLERDQLGGRARSWNDRKTGDPIHIGPHILLSEYPNFMKLLERVGARDKVVWQPRGLFTIFDGPQATPIEVSSLPAPFHLVPSMVRDTSIANWDKISSLPATLFAMQLTEEDILRLDRINAEALLRGLGVNEATLRRFWDFASMSIMNVPLELCSAGALMRFYARLIGTSGYCVGFPDGGLGDLFVPGAVRLIEGAGGRIVLGADVRRIRTEGERITGLELTDGTSVAARVVVSSIPPQDLLRILPGAWADHHPLYTDLSAFQPCPYISVYLWFDRKITELQFWARAHSPRDLNCDFYDLSNINRGWSGRPSLIASNIIYSHRAANLDDDQIVARTLRELAEAIPLAGEARLVHSVVNRIPMAIHCPFPGTENRRPPQRAPAGLILAGDWVRTELPSSMESAAFSGWRAAEEARRDLLGERRPLSVGHKSTEGLARILRETSRLFPLKRVPLWLHGLS
jgi:15-cis-phytoene desaturase